MKEVSCFHCSEPVLSGQTFTTDINGRTELMCCAGCQAVAQAIMDAGLNNYYKFRTEPGKKQSTLVPDELNSFSAYDLNEVQKEFVHNKNDIQSVSLSIDGITCSACAWLIENKVKQLAGVVKVLVNSTTQRAIVEWVNSEIKLSAILNVINKIGYVAAPFQIDKQEEKADKNSRQFLLRLGLAGFATMQVMMFALALYRGYFTDLDIEFRDYFRWVSMIFAAPVALYSAQPFYFSAIRSIFAGKINMDVAVSIAILGAFFASCIATINGSGEVYYESVSMFTFFLLLGRYFEQKAKQKASVNSSNLHKLVPLTANLLTDNKIIEVAAKQLEVNQIILVKPGEVIAADGLIIEGSTSINESMLTGEHLPVTKNIGAQVFAGTINVEQPIKVEINAIGNDQFVAEIIRLQEVASNNRPAISLLVDKLARYFSAGVLSISFITYIIWYYFISSEDAFWVTLSVLVATCPCALSLATPTAVTCATAMFTKLGIITRRSGVFETLPQIQQVIFDKTGTLTYGNLSIKSVDTSVSNQKTDILEIIASLEHGSIHPVAKTFSPYYRNDKYQVHSIKHHVGKGLLGKIGEHKYKVGSFSFVCLPLQNINSSGLAFEHEADELNHQTIWLSKNDEIIARISFEDVIRVDAYATIDNILQQKIKIVIASGDNKGPVKMVAEQLGVRNIHHNLSPNDKLQLVNEFQANGKKVAMFGDGINDAPVLAGADLSVAIGSGTDIAKNSADLIFLGDKLSRFNDAITVAKKTTAIIKQNLFWALGYNIIVLPLAVSGNIAPYIAAIGMSLSSLIVVSNSLRLLKEPT
ncbi:heavy metal translocating P-type ATPase [Parashewanella spongiae]|uniref:P-type Cu(2+) transporter n=1 Tax=Parashewanella spongiae TaxID=342950 RepID=A0A3A6UHN0_9GAMM|nr:heavy metal translocating P-type ATPase [Parashewanella spongiae]MCL1077262.1 heavy metal translocating P-type ATPase [Parashewanella spongiae]RJY18554.1 heavy metal translocating P-type ATPase [Parashewanella spongiae]